MTDKITLFVKLTTGKSIALELVDKDMMIYDVILQICKKENIEVFDFIKVATLMHAGRTLNRTLTLSDYRIGNHSTIQVILKGHGYMYVDLKTLKITAECPITHETIINPYILDPGCRHIFETEALAEWVKNGNTTCPVCCAEIDETLFTS